MEQRGERVRPVHASNYLILYNKCFLQSFGRDKEIYIYFFIAVVLYNFVLCFYAVSIINTQVRRTLKLKVARTKVGKRC